MNTKAMTADFVIREATVEDCDLIMTLIKELADYERLSHEVEATAEKLRETLFGSNRVAEVLIAELQGTAIGYALFFQSFSTFTGRPGLYLEDIYVKPNWRGKGFGKSLMIQIAQLAVERQCSRLEWAVLDWNAPSISFYRSIDAVPMEGWTVQRLSGQPLKNLALESD
jgi:GNAT superfamily N-acetyltransferase